MPIRVAITLGCYRLYSFVRLNLAACQSIFPDAPILVSDDASPESPKIRAIAEEMGASYICTPQRLSHFTGDLRHLLSSIQFAEAKGVDVGIKLSLRLVPATAKFREAAESAFSDPDVQMAVPGSILVAQIARPQQLFYSRFTLLSDCVSIRRGTITASEVLQAYRERLDFANLNPSAKTNTLIETLIDHLRSSHKTAVLTEWSQHKLDEPKAFLRKSMATEREYQDLAESLGLPRERYLLNEWPALEGRAAYRLKSHTV